MKKQLTHEVFNYPHCPPDAKSAAVGSGGWARWYDAPIENLIPNEAFFMTKGDGVYYSRPIGDGYDTSNWRESAISRSDYE